MARFLVTGTFVLESRKLFVLAGVIIDGEVRRGQCVRVPLAGKRAVNARIEAIEFARRSSDREDACLCIGYADPVELAFWQGLSLEQETLEVSAEP
jgi:hypothetical protein